MVGVIHNHLLKKGDILVTLMTQVKSFSSLRKNTKDGLMYVSHKCIDVDSYIIPKKKPDGVEDVMQ